ncbi:MAG: hypothetical protein COA79_20905 [Planctomycetota bacterium]|nr:MAG: hypothetical protein COA79_20905 [Planctomycetota bacterium]
MVKKLLRPFVVGAFIVVLVLVFVIYFMYGSSQNSKWHFIVQQYYMTEYLPKWMLNEEKYHHGLLISSTNFTGVWTEWHRNGNKKLAQNIVKGDPEGKFEIWHENGQKSDSVNFKNGGYDGVCKGWYESGILMSKIVYSNGNIISAEYFDSSGKTMTKKIFKKQIQKELDERVK